MKITKKQFELFKSECEHWYKKLELSGYKMYYHLGGTVKNVFCTVQIKHIGRVASLFLNKEFYNKDDISINIKIKETAKHEMIHILLGRMSFYIYERFINENEAEESEEELVRKLEKLIK